MTGGEFRQRALGAVVGSAVGDALGAPFEFGPAGRYSARFPEPVVGGIGEMVGGGGFGWAPGEFTDDTQMAIVQAESLLDRGGIDGADLFDRFRTWAAAARDVGVSTRQVLTSDLPWDEAAPTLYERNPRSGAGNGALMRSTPSAVHYATGSVDATIEAARQLAIITHGDPAAGWGTAIHHVMVRAALHGDDPFDALTDTLDRLPDDQDRYRRMLDPDWTPDDMEVANGSVWGCLAQAVWAVRTTDTFADAVIAAIDLGGDTDTVAAVAGGLAGAVHGIQAIPSRWTTYLHGHVTGRDGQRTYRSPDLQVLTIRLLGGTPHAEQPANARGKGPTEVADGLYAADLTAAGDVPTDWAVVSLCRVGNRFADHPIRRELYLVDQTGLDRNADLASVLVDAVDTIDALLAEGRQVVVHCHGGESRTGFVLRGWLMRRHGWNDETATAHLRERWPHVALWTDDFTAALAAAPWAATEVEASPDESGRN